MTILGIYFGYLFMHIEIESTHEDTERLEARQRHLEGIERLEAWLRGFEGQSPPVLFCSEAEEQKREEEISVKLQWLSSAESGNCPPPSIISFYFLFSSVPNQMRKKKRDVMIQRILEAKSLDDIINELNCIEQRHIKQQQQGQEDVQQQPLSGDPEKNQGSDKKKQRQQDPKQNQDQQQQQEQQKQHEQQQQQNRHGQKDQPQQQGRVPKPYDDNYSGYGFARDSEEHKSVNKSGQVKPQQQYQQEKHEQQQNQSLQEKAQQEGQQDQQKQQGLRQKVKLNQGQQEEQQQEAQRDQQLGQGQQGQKQQQKWVPVHHDANSKVYGLLCFLILLSLLLPPVSAQCSTCLGGRCYDTGQCILGCVPGYMNQYCDKTCPSNCLNNACELNTTSATITCIDGCKAGYCGTKCTRPCPEGCVTCDRQCGYCNKTLCPERRYGEGCRSVCSPTYEKCDRETGECIKCRHGYFGDNCDRKCPTCFSKGRNLIYKCLSGCEVCKEQDSCPDGLFGGNCELECSEKCGKSQETARHPCNRATGECSVGCVSGNHGLNCNYTCNEFCEGKLCNQHNGVCTSGCISGYTQTSKSCEMLQDTGVKDEPVSNTLLIILIICVSFVLIFLILSLVYFVSARRSLRRRQKSFDTGNADKKERQSLT